jgi:hypothetical protein
VRQCTVFIGRRNEEIALLYAVSECQGHWDCKFTKNVVGPHVYSVGVNLSTLFCTQSQLWKYFERITLLHDG